MHLMNTSCALVQGMRFEITKPLNQNFFLSHSLFMGNMELGTGGRQVRVGVDRSHMISMTYES